MVNANELRIGNSILWNPKYTSPETTLPPLQVVVKSISEGKIGYVSPNIDNRVEPFEDDVVEKDTPHKFLEEFESIPLSPEVLEKCGFKQNRSLIDGKYWQIEGKLRIESKGDEFWFKSEEGKANLHYFHQLQNLYFALTGGELEVNL
jgi:hypothetical protein